MLTGRVGGGRQRDQRALPTFQRFGLSQTLSHTFKHVPLAPSDHFGLLLNVNGLEKSGTSRPSKLCLSHGTHPALACAHRIDRVYFCRRRRRASVAGLGCDRWRPGKEGRLPTVCCTEQQAAVGKARACSQIYSTALAFTDLKLLPRGSSLPLAAGAFQH